MILSRAGRSEDPGYRGAMSARWLPLAIALLTACAGPSDTEATDADTDVDGVVSGGVIPLDGVGVLGVLTWPDGRSVGYLCGQGEAIEETRWLSGSGELLEGADYTATLGEDGAVEVTGPDRTWSETWVPFEGGGLYEGFPDGCRTGLLAWPAGAGGWETAGTWCNDVGSFAQVEPVGTFVPREPQISVRVEHDAETLQFDLDRVR